jgi:hypothetical protein
MHAIERAQAGGEELRYKEAFSTDSLCPLRALASKARHIKMPKESYSCDHQRYN